MNIGKLNLEISKAPSNLGEANVAAKSAQKLNDGLIQNVGTVGDLPTASTNCGRQFFVTGDQDLYFSDGTKWNATSSKYQLWGWGHNGYGELGTNIKTCYSTPQQEVCGGIDWCMVSAGLRYSSAIKSDGTLWSMGNNNNGRLGTNNTTCYSKPTQEVCGGTTWCMVSADHVWIFPHTSAIKTDGTLWSWGHNSVGELGTNDVTCRSAPTQEHCGGTNWCMVSSDGAHTSAIKTDGTLWGWGDNNAGQLGLNNTICYSTPTQEVCGGTTWCTVSGGRYHTSAIKTDGTLWSWGCNNNFQLGTNNGTSYSTPQQEHCGGTTWCMVTAGYSSTMAIKTDGTLWGWGYNNRGQLATNTVTSYLSPQQEVCGGTNWCMVNFGCHHALAIKTDGTLWGWGCNRCSVLGTNNYICYSTPAQELCGFNWCMVSAGQCISLGIRIV